MTIKLSQPDFQRLTNIIQSQAEFASPVDRRSLISLAFGQTNKGNVILSRLNMSGSPMTASVELLNLLCNFGQVEPGYEALGAFLDQLLSNMGISSDSEFMEEIIHNYNLVNVPPVVIPTGSITLPNPMVNASPHYVFISYARPDQPIADQVETYVKAAGFRVFRDIRDIRTGNNWDMKIEKALNAATHMVLLLSKASMPYRKEVHREWFYFDQHGKSILPLYLQDCKLHSRMVSYNYIDARVNLNSALSKLVSDIV